MKSPTFSLLVLFCASACAIAEPRPLFDGKSFAGWEGDTTRTWRIEEGAIVGGSVAEKVPRNEFLATTKPFTDFELRLKFKLIGSEGQINAGVQIRSQRIPQHFEMIGYQADLGEKYYGALYDESRRNKVLAAPEPAAIAAALKANEWNEYRIRCEGRRIQLWINGTQTVDYTEADEKIPQTGFIALQIHGGGKAEVRYKDLVLEELSH
ncbi:MAG TPA: DUF1080 domain-containing protein [Chthoniobacteraceae bacterium]|jgi:hypothetical protein|nr:DUF1080 domain-containing protein [Chthoniobacteraceae bacterium]